MNSKMNLTKEKKLCISFHNQSVPFTKEKLQKINNNDLINLLPYDALFPRENYLRWRSRR